MMEENKIRELLQVAVEASIDGGQKILEVYESDFAVEHKDDKSPLTLADKKAHEAISEHLKITGLPILSEEGREILYEERKEWEYFWMVDPLDGTKEFIKRNGEFTVNIALIYNGDPVMGVIYVPVKEELYFGAKDMGAYRTTSPDIADIYKGAEKLPLDMDRTNFTVVASRSHMSPETEEFVEQLKQEHGEVEIASMGSSLKICLVAEGSADIYPRFAPTMEWDTAAGQGIAQAAGKQVINHNSGEKMKYNKENLLNDWFIVK